jgi:DNA-binding CsgD family transcriptional regulator
MPDHSRHVLESLPILVTTHANDGEGTYTGVYTDLQVKSLESPKDLIGEPLRAILNPDATERLLETFEAAVETGTRQYTEYPVRFGDEEFWRCAYTAPLPTESGDEPAEVITAGVDITRHDERERALYDVFDALEAHSARPALERAFCDRLVEERRYEMAWIGATDRRDGVTVRAAAGADAYLADLRDAVDGLDAAADPGVRALRSGESVSTNPIPANDRRWTTVAAAHDLQAAIALPLEHEGIEHGVLAVYLADTEYLVPWREAVLVDYTDAVGYALSAAMWQWALAADTAATLTVHATSTLPLMALCEAAGGATLDVVSVVPRPDETVYYLRGADGDRLRAAAERCDGIEPYGVPSVETPAVVVGRETPEHRLVRAGARIRSFGVTPDAATIRLTVPGSEIARHARTVLQEGYPAPRITVQWGNADADADADGHPTGVDDVLTDRQYEMLEAAYRHGYFDRDRKCNLTELADELDLSRWTVSEHLRAAQREVCAHLLD